MTRKPTISPLLSILVAATCVFGGAGCSDDEDEAPEVIVVDPWSIAFGGSGTSVQVTQVAAGASGNVAIGGTFTGSIDLGAGALSSTAEPNLFLAKLDTAGEHIWSGRTGGGDDFVNALALDRGGNAIAAGNFNGKVDFGDGGALDGQNEVFLTRFGIEGDPLWAKAFGGSGSASVNDIAVDRSRNTYLLGSANGDISFGSGPILDEGSYANLYVAKVNSDGGPVYSVGFSTNNYCEGRDIAVDADGNAFILGNFYGSVDFGTGAIGSTDSNGIFVLKLQPTGKVAWAKGFGGVFNGGDFFGYIDAVDVATDSSGEVAITGNFSGEVDFGGGKLGSPSGNGSLFLVKLGADGKYLWSKGFVEPNGTYGDVRGVGIDANGDVHIAGNFNGSLDFGGGDLLAGDQDIFLANFDSSGKYLSSRAIGGSAYENLSAFTVTTGGNPILVGSFSGTLDFGATKLTAPSDSSQSFVAALAP